MTEVLTGEIAKIRSLRVISRTSVLQYKDTRKTSPEIAREIGVDGLIEGSAFREGDRIRISLQLIDGRADSHVWSERYERDLGSALSLQSEVARAVAAQVRHELTPAEQALLTASRKVRPRAYEAYLRAAQAQGPFGAVRASKQALEHYERAVEIDPDFAEAWASLAVRRSVLGEMEFDPSRGEEARNAAERALELDDRLGRAHTALGKVRQNYDWNFAGARRAFERGYQLSPTDGMVLAGYTYFLGVVEGRTHEALALSELVSRTPTMHEIRGLTFSTARQFERAIEEYELARGLDPDHYSTGESDAWFMLGRFHQAGRAVQAFHERGGSWGRNAAQDWADGGWKEHIRARLEAAKKRTTGNPARFASNYVRVGDLEEALAWLERGYRVRDPFMNTVNTNPEFDALRTDLRFENLMRRIGFPDLGEDPGVLGGTGEALAHSARPSEAIARLERAIELSPSDPRLYRWCYGMALAHFASAQYAAAGDWALRTLAPDASQYTAADAQLLLATSHAQAGHTEQARAALDEALSLWPGFTSKQAPLPGYTHPDLSKRYLEGLRIAGFSD